MRTIAALLSLALLAGAGFAAPPAPIQVMIIGDFHMSNPGRDMHNVSIDDVLAPRRQMQIVAVTDALARFRPTGVAAEWDAATATERYGQYLAGTLAPSRNEVVQLGFRLAAKMHLSQFHGIDVEGEFPYDAVDTYAKAHGQSAILTAADAGIGTFVAQLQDKIDHGTIGGALRWLNDPARIARGNEFYRATLHVGGGAEQPGADLLTAWYRRNFLICANLVQFAKPGDRIVVFYGSGHSLLLRQCVAETAGFQLIEPNGYLPK